MAFADAVDRHVKTVSALLDLQDEVSLLSDHLWDTFQQGGKVLFMGNGGSAADCQHFAAEFIVKYDKDRRPLPAIALTVDTSILTAHGNDYGYESVFDRQVSALATPQDLVIGISTSGNSPNVVSGLRTALEVGATCWAWTGASAGACGDLEGVHSLRVPTKETARVQESLLLVGHWLCEDVDVRMQQA